MREKNLFQSDVQIDKQIAHSKTIQPIFIYKSVCMSCLKKVHKNNPFGRSRFQTHASPRPGVVGRGGADSARR